jgi:cysteine desulfurase
MSKNRRTVYLDYSASTPTDPRVVEAMMPYFSEVYGNASSLHSFGRKAEQAIEDARETLATIFNCQPSEIIFTSGGSESDNLAIRGAAWTAKERGNHLITTPVEHSAVSRTVGQLADMMGFEKTVLPVDQYAMVDVEEFANACHSGTTVASIIYANNEVGTIAPIPQLAAQAKERGVLFHTDAVQAAGQLTLDVQTLGVDMMSISGHKFYGPKGVGALYVRKGIDLSPHMTGGSHESGRRAGTHNTPFIVGMAKALQLAYDERESRLAHYKTMRDALIDGILNSVSDTHLSGHPEQRLPSHASFVFEGVDSTKLLMYLDMKGIAASSASACKTGNPEPSGVLLAMGYKPELASGSLRLSVGQHTTMEDVEYTLNALVESVEKLRKLNKAFAG